MVNLLNFASVQSGIDEISTVGVLEITLPLSRVKDLLRVLSEVVA